MKSSKMLIAGQWMDASDGAQCRNRNPAALDDLNAAFPLATVEDAGQAVAAAKQARAAWAELPSPGRGGILEKAAQVIDAGKKQLVALKKRGTAS